MAGGVLMAASLATAAWMTLPYPGPVRPYALAVYRAVPPGGSPRMRVRFTFEGVAGRTARLSILSDGAIGSVLILSNALIRCRPSVGSLGSLHPITPANAPVPVDASGTPIGGVYAFTGSFDVAVTRQECELNAAPHHDDYSSLRAELVTGYRYFTRAGAAYVPDGRVRFAPVLEYTLRLDPGVLDPTFEGGVAVAHEPLARRLNDADAAVVARWRDINLAGTREFSLFVLAGAVALGASMLIELLKPLMLEMRK